MAKPRVWFLVVLCLVLCSSFVLAPKPTPQIGGQLVGLSIVYPKIESLQQGTNTTFYVHVFNFTGLPLIGNNVSCTLHVYNYSSGEHLSDQRLTIDGVDYEATINTTITNTLGTYPYIVYCNRTADQSGGFVSTSFDVTPTGLPLGSGENLTPVAVIVLIPLIVAIIILVGAVTLNERHGAIKIGLWLLSIASFFSSAHLGVISITRFYQFPEFVDGIGTLTFWVAFTFFILSCYVLIYAMWVMLETARNKKNERLQY